MKAFLKNKTLLRVLTDAALLVPLLACVYSLEKFWPAKAKRGFFCNDQTLQYPYRPDTVERSMIIKIGFFIPLCIILLWESCKFMANYLKFKGYLRQWAKFYLWRLYINLLWLTFGAAAEKLLKIIAKHTVARLRPDFFAVCRPYLPKDGSDCTALKNHGVYIEEYECSSKYVANNSKEMLQRMHLSFPSGHASFACYGMVFLVLYMYYQCRVVAKNARNANEQQQQERIAKSWHIFNMPIILPALQLLCISVAWFVALSRLLDYKHHGSDVAAGCVLGSSVAIVVYRCYVLPHLHSVELYLLPNITAAVQRNPAASAVPRQANSISCDSVAAHTVDMPMSSQLSLASLKSTFHFSGGKKATPNIQQVV